MDMVLSLISNLKINSTIYIMMGIFVGTYWISYVLFLRRLSGFLVERDNRTQGRSDSVDHLNKELQLLSEDLHNKKKQAQIEAEQIFSSIKQKAADEQAAILKRARDEAQAELKHSREEIEKEYRLQFEKLRSEVPAIANEIISKLLMAGKRPVKNDLSSVRKEML
jgi:F0F1-type ATP synthase membrane subunit b/b'